MLLGIRLVVVACLVDVDAVVSFSSSLSACLFRPTGISQPYVSTSIPSNSYCHCSTSQCLICLIGLGLLLSDSSPNCLCHKNDLDRSCILPASFALSSLPPQIFRLILS